MTNRAASKEPLKIAVLSSASAGGAGIAARRVADALNLSEDMEADFIDMVAMGGRMPDDAAPPGSMSNRSISDTHFTVEYPGFVRGWVIDLLQQYDILNIHWASFLLGLAEIDELSRRGMPILFTCHDYYYFTGGCHYPATCKQLAKGCIGCPQVNTDYCSPEIIARNRRLKKAILSRPNVHLSAPSAFLVGEAIKAGMICEQRTHVLRNPYRPIERFTGQKKTENLRIVLLADSMAERRKAMPLAIESLKLARSKLNSQRNSDESFVVEIIGGVDDVFMSAVNAGDFQFQAHGRLTRHEEIAEVLGRSHLLLTCSREDNWPNVLVESGAYGVIPVVGPGHGCEEFVDRLGAGKVAPNYSPDAFADAIISALEHHSPASSEELQLEVNRTHSPQRICDSYYDVLCHALTDSAYQQADH